LIGGLLKAEGCETRRSRGICAILRTTPGLLVLEGKKKMIVRGNVD